MSDEYVPTLTEFGHVQKNNMSLSTKINNNDYSRIFKLALSSCPDNLLSHFGPQNITLKINLPKTSSLPLKIDGWNTRTFPFGVFGLFSGVNSLLVSGRVKVDHCLSQS